LFVFGIETKLVLVESVAELKFFLTVTAVLASATVGAEEGRTTIAKVIVSHGVS